MQISRFAMTALAMASLMSATDGEGNDLGGTAPATVDKAAEAAEKARLKEEAKAAAKAEKERLKAEAAAAKEAAKAEKQRLKEEAAAKAKAEAEALRPTSNGVRRPKPDTLCGQAWAIFDAVSQKNGAPATISESLVFAREQGLNEGNVRAEYAQWRKFFGITGRLVDPIKEAEKAEKARLKAEEKAEKERIKAEEKARKEAEKAAKKQEEAEAKARAKAEAEAAGKSE